MLQKMLRYGYQEALLNEIDESLLAKVERLDSPPLLDYLDAHLNEERYCDGTYLQQRGQTYQEIVAWLYVLSWMAATLWIRPS